MLLTAIIMNCLMVYFAIDYSKSQKTVTVRNLSINKTKQMKYDEIIFIVLGMFTYNLVIFNFNKTFSSFLTIITVLWLVKIIYERNRVALYQFKDDPIMYNELRQNIWKEYIYILPMVVIAILVSIIALLLDI